MTARGKGRHLFDWLISYTQGFVQFGNAREGQGYPAGLPALVIRAIGEDRGGQDGFLGNRGGPDLLALIFRLFAGLAQELIIFLSFLS
ncbi:hypothetical protein MTHERMOG20_26080 [Moorella thermoacetica]|uniref:Uncharacterized protein n=3 Tax=Neomoorella thermoacetica TaxID=1525 RepID=A0A1D7XDQ1_NEOTH|nr:hypothetical protein [Moorella thermoacetica]BCV22527.1 hypothetical protein hamaS1_25960 [Moorella sp. Hama-1]GAF25278.1 ribonuclease D [Moorella thermoacetica Y72]AKX94901.1 hypothetical protein MOTHE_c21180 [Moorella thermoacetica]AKX97530.1 hypothetical protein MOTHA_c21940 [Moorella thermoacetica]AOQ25030.1 hypothetical protein Maut_02610 [Moorella thermoacetica]